MAWNPVTLIDILRIRCPFFKESNALSDNFSETHRKESGFTMNNKILSRLNSLDALTSPPPLLSEILTLINQDSSSAKKLSEVILKDPNLTARVLRVANSSFYGYRQKVATVNQAVMILGFNAVKCLILSISIYNQVSAQHSSPEDDYIKLWQHFLESATAAQNIALSINYNLTEEAYIAGLLHDFGMLFLQKYYPAESQQVRRLIADGFHILKAEQKVFEMDHQQIGSSIAAKWNLPLKLTEAICDHHPKSEDEIAALPLLSKMIILADNLSPSNFEIPDNIEGAGYKIKILEGCCTSIGMGMEDIKKIYNVLPKQVLYQAEGMNLNLGDAVQYLSQMNTELFDLYIDLANIFKERQELSRRLLAEERIEGTLESLHIALATLSHYINNSTMNISGQCEVMKLLHGKHDKDEIYNRIPVMADSIKSSIKRISLVLEELSNITSMEKINFFKHSRAIDIEKSLKERLEGKAMQVI